RLPRPVGAVDREKFLLQDRLGDSRIETLDIPVFTLSNLTPGCQDPRAGDPTGVDRVSQCGVSIDARVPEIAHGGEAALPVFARQLRAQQHTFTRRLYDR